MIVIVIIDHYTKNNAPAVVDIFEVKVMVVILRMKVIMIIYLFFSELKTCFLRPSLSKEIF